ncbi:MAG: hypothetical protein ABWX67_14330 [Allosphingosinicella sp.]
MIAVILAAALASAPAPALADIGPEPAMEEFAALAEAALARKLDRPEKKMIFEWPYRLVAGPAGYYTCGRVHGRRGQGRQEVWVSAVVAHGQAVDAQWSTKNGMLAWMCKKEVKKGNLVPR